MKPGFEVVCLPGMPAEFRLIGTPAVSFVTFAEDPVLATAAILIGRLHYRDEAMRGLPASVRESLTSATDAGFALAVHRQLGAAGLARLEGEFSLAVWDPRRRRLLALRDPFGAWPLYWTIDGPGVAVSTHITSLGGRRSYNLEYFSRFLMASNAFTELPGETTPFEGVQRVPAGTLVTLGPGPCIQRTTTWDWAGLVERQEPITLVEAGARCEDLLRRAVDERVARGSVAAHLSGGMDSSSVVCQARRCLDGSGGMRRLTTLSLVYRNTHLAGERAFAEMVVNQGGLIDGRFIDADEALDFDWFGEGIPEHDEPYAGLFRMGMERLLIDEAHRAGAATILTGTGADDFLDGRSLQIAGLVRRGRWIESLAEARRWARATNRSLADIWWRRGLGPNIPPSLRDGIGTWLRRGRGGWPALSATAVPLWIAREFARDHDLWEKGLDFARSLYTPSAERSADLCAIQTCSGNWSSWHLAAPLGMANSHPFLDPRLVEFCLRVPRAVRESLGTRKPVLREAMRGIVPEPIRARRDKRGFNDIYWCGLAQSAQPGGDGPGYQTQRPRSDRHREADSRNAGACNGDRRHPGRQPAECHPGTRCLVRSHGSCIATAPDESTAHQAQNRRCSANAVSMKSQLHGSNKSLAECLAP